MRLNQRVPSVPIFTHEGAKAVHVNAERQLRRLVMANMLWEDQFYMDGESTADLIEKILPHVAPEKCAELAIEAREKMKLRHVPLLIVRLMAKLESHKGLVAKTLERIVQRPDELSEFLAIYWKDERQPLSWQVKRGLARAFAKFNEYSLAKYNQDRAVKLKDVLFLVHSKPADISGRGKKAPALDRKGYVRGETRRHANSVYTRLVEGTMETPDTWEVELSASTDKLGSWKRLLSEGQVGALALLRNLRNMKEAGVSDELVKKALAHMKTERVLPFRFIAAAKYAPHLEPQLEEAMFRCLEEYPKLAGKTALVVDVSGSMYQAKISEKSEMNRFEAAAALAMLCREVCQDVVVVTFSNFGVLVPSRRGFALRDAMDRSQVHSATNTQFGLNVANNEGYDRVIVFTDEQSHQQVQPPLRGARGYFVNVAAYQHGIGYGDWLHIDGWSEAILDYIAVSESEEY